MAFLTKENKNNLSEQVYLMIKEKIINGDLTPGQKLKETQLAKMLDASRTPIREALSRLQMEGLVVSGASQGVEVTNFTPKTMYSLFECNSVLEGLAAKKAAENITQDTIFHLEETLYLAEKYFKEGLLEKVVEKNTDFHDLIVKSSDSVSVIHMMSLIKAQVLAYRSFISSFNFRATFMEEHFQILHAIKNRDGDLSEKLMREHIIKDFEAIHSELESYFQQNK